MKNSDKMSVPVVPIIKQDNIPDSIAEIPKQNNSLPAHSEPCELPSKGLLYHPTSPLYNQEQVEIKYPTTRHQDILLNRTYINKLIAIDKLIEDILGNPAINYQKLLLGDRNAIAYQTRINMHGPMYNPRLICPNCLEKITNLSIDLEKSRKFHYFPSEEEMTEQGIELKDLEGYKSFVIKTQRFGTEIEFIVGTVESEQEVLKLSKARAKNNLPESNRTNELRTLIVGINGIKGQALVNEIQNLRALDVSEFLKAYQFVSPDIRTVHDFVCPNCGHEEELNINIDVNFFWYRP